MCATRSRSAVSLISLAVLAACSASPGPSEIVDGGHAWPDASDASIVDVDASRDTGADSRPLVTDSGTDAPPLPEDAGIADAGIADADIADAGRDAAPPAAPSVLTSEWYLTRGTGLDDWGWTVTAGSDGNLYFAASLDSTESSVDVRLYKVSPSGAQVWETTWGGPWDDTALTAVMSGEHIYVGGQTYHGTRQRDADMFVAKFRIADGYKVWDTVIDGQGYYDSIQGLAVEGESVYASGWCYRSLTDPDACVFRLIDRGVTAEESWTTIWGTAGRWDEANGQLVVDAHNVYVAGRYDAPLLGGDARLMAFDKETGMHAWQSSWGRVLLDDGLGLTTHGSALYMVGMTQTLGSGSDIFALKYSLAPDGSEARLEWDRVWSGPYTDVSRAAVVDEASGRIFIVGHTGVGDDSAGSLVTGDLVVIEYTADGDLLGETLWGGPQGERAGGAAMLGDSIYAAGHTSSYGAGGADALLVRLSISPGR